MLAVNYFVLLGIFFASLISAQFGINTIRYPLYNNGQILEVLPESSLRTAVNEYGWVIYYNSFNSTPSIILMDPLTNLSVLKVASAASLDAIMDLRSFNGASPYFILYYGASEMLMGQEEGTSAIDIQQSAIAIRYLVTSEKTVGLVRFFDGTFLRVTLAAQFPHASFIPSEDIIYPVHSTVSVEGKYAEIRDLNQLVYIRQLGIDTLPATYPYIGNLANLDHQFMETSDVLYWSYRTPSDIVVRDLTRDLTHTIDGPYLVHTFVPLGPTNNVVLVIALDAEGLLSVITYDFDAQLEYSGSLDLIPNLEQVGKRPISVSRINDTSALLTYVKRTEILVFLVTVGAFMTPVVNSPGNVTVTQNSTLVVEESVVLENIELEVGSTLVVSEGAVITVTGCAKLAGTLVIVLSNGTIVEARNITIDITVIYTTCREGEFDQITLETDAELDACERLTGTPIYGPASISVVVKVDDSECDSTDYTGLIIGVVIGGAVLIVGILLLAFYCSPIRSKVFPYARK